MHVGSGIIVDAGGVILTNHHVVAAAEKVTIRLVDGQEYVARDIVSDSMSDLAILRIDANVPLTAAKLGDSDEMNIGDWVIAIGSPFELETTVSAGIISAKGRGIDKIKRGRLLQTDAAINPGNSGGPLVNLDGEVIGISTAIATSYGGYQGVGFAIPANRAKWVWSELSNHGTVRRASLGIGIGELDARQAAQFEMTARSGVWVRRVYPNSAGADAGLKEDDVIIEFAGEPVQMPRDLQDLVEQTAIGAKVPVKVRRNGQVLVLDVVPKELD
jgi:serine protease Do